GGNWFYLNNAGSTNLSLKLGIDGSKLSNPSGADLNKVYIVLTPAAAGGVPQKLSLASLASASSSGGLALNLTLAAGTTAEYEVQVSMDATAVSATTNSVT